MPPTRKHPYKPHILVLSHSFPASLLCVLPENVPKQHGGARLSFFSKDFRRLVTFCPTGEIRELDLFFYFRYPPFVASPCSLVLLFVHILVLRREACNRHLGVAAAASSGFSPLLLHGRGWVRPTDGTLDAAGDGPALRVRLVKLLDGIPVPLNVAIARRGRGVDAALALLETGR